MLSTIKYAFKVTKPRIKSANQQSLQVYRKELHEARVRVHKQSTEYMNKIQDQFLQKHKKRMARRHFNRQCGFRAKIARNSFLIFSNLQKERQDHKQYLRRMQKFVKQQQIKKLNRDRIRKILEYESSNFWLQGQRIQQKTIIQRLLPQYIASTEYYHKLQSQALAYDDLDFDLLHKLSSNEQSLKYKNQLLIPLYKEILILMRQVKFSEQERINKQFQQTKIKLEQKYKNDNQRYNEQVETIKAEFDKKMRQLSQRKSNQKQFLKSKIKEFIHLLKKWKQYTDILGMTSAEVLKIIGQQKYQQEIRARTKILQQQIAKTRQKTFVDAVEEDTEDDQISLTSYLQKKEGSNQAAKNIKKSESIESFNEQLERLIKQQQGIFNQVSKQIQKQEQNKKKNTQFNVQINEKGIDLNTFNEELKIDQGYLKPTQTTTSVEVLKQQYAGDQVLKNLFNIAGQLTIQYPKLFQKIWSLQVL